MRLTVHWHELNAACKRAFVLGIAGALLLLGANVACRVHPEPSLGNLKNFSRVEICFLTSALDWVCPEYSRGGLLSAGELEYLAALQRMPVSDPQRVASIVRVLRAASYSGPFQEQGRFRTDELRLVCYRDGDSPLSLRVLAGMEEFMVVTESGDTFAFKRPFADLLVLLQDVSMFATRTLCADNLLSLGNILKRLLSADPQGSAPKKWCDAIARELRDDGVPRKVFSSTFQCRAANGGKWHYAVNANWAPNFPPDTVQLYETKAGWNQHGGPELFTFDNHDPKGGCVLLNDGTVKFIRTEEELGALRWK